MSEPVSHSVVLSHKRVMAAAIRSRSRQAVSPWWLFAGLGVALFAAIWLSGPVAFYLVQRLSFEWMFRVGEYLPTFVLAVFGVLAIAFVAGAYDRANRRKQLREFARLGIPLENEATYTILPEGLRLATARITIQPVWEAVDTVEKVSDGWVIAAEQLTMFVPAESFPDAAAEKTFIAALVAHLTPEARDRSPQACALSGQV